MIDPYVCIGTPYRPRLLIIVVYGIFLNEITGRCHTIDSGRARSPSTIPCRCEAIAGDAPMRITLALDDDVANPPDGAGPASTADPSGRW